MMKIMVMQGESEIFLMVLMKDDGDGYIVEDEEGLGMINGIEGCMMRV